jgi:hypothetical protein
LLAFNDGALTFSGRSGLRYGIFQLSGALGGGHFSTKTGLPDGGACKWQLSARFEDLEGVLASGLIITAK